MAKSPLVSVVIPAYKEATYIDRLLEALCRQDFNDFEVIVSDARSKDGTKEVIESFKNKLDIKLVEAAPKGPAFGRNQGAKHASGEWLLFLDADVDLPNSNFVNELLNKTIAKHWQTSSAQLRVMPGSFLGKIGHNQAYMNFMAHTKHPIFQGYCMFTSREVFKKLNGFNEKIKYGEDNDYATRAAPYGFGFVRGVSYMVDPRRYQQEGIKLLFKNMAHELYRLTHGFSFEENSSEYKFGEHRRRGN